MIEVETIGEGQLALRVKGKIERDDIVHAMKELNAATEANQAINLLIDMSEFSGMTVEALIADARFGFSHLSKLHHYKRVAVITDADWMKSIIWLENQLFRSIDIRTFAPEDADNAERFIAGHDIPEPKHEPSVIRLPSNRPDLMVFEIHDKLRRGDAQAVFGFLNDAYKQHGKIDLMVIIRDYEGFELGMLLDGATWKSKTNSITQIDQYAIVGGPPFLTATAQFVGSFLPVEIKTFELKELDEAWKWLGARRLLT
ncbi:MAG: STAS/SEC14 domain-containing protein [Pseudomonadota bacterium]